MRGGCGVLYMMIFVFLPSHAETQWRLAEAELAIGEHSGVFFVDIADLFARDDRLYVADGGSNNVSVFDRATGRIIATAGRDGERPGEFLFLRSVDDCGTDTIFVSDPGLNRVTVLSPDLDLIRTIPLPPLIYTGIGCAGSGTLVGIIRNRDPCSA